MNQGTENLPCPATWLALLGTKLELKGTNLALQDTKLIMLGIKLALLVINLVLVGTKTARMPTGTQGRPKRPKALILDPSPVRTRLA